MRKVFMFFVLVIFCTLQVAMGQAVEEWVVQLHEPHMYNDMPYRIMKPLNFDSNKKYPLIVSLHGGGGRGSDNLKLRKNGSDSTESSHSGTAFSPSTKPGSTNGERS